jgi:hypothetical protein
MLNKIKALLRFMLLATFFTVPVNAQAQLSLGDISLEGFGSRIISEVIPTNAITIKSKKPYSEADDPALKRCSDATSRRQWEYFVVPGVLLGVFVLAVYTRKED